MRLKAFSKRFIAFIGNKTYKPDKNHSLAIQVLLTMQQGIDDFSVC